jgi:hypothetical protein
MADEIDKPTVPWDSNNVHEEEMAGRSRLVKIPVQESHWWQSILVLEAPAICLMHGGQLEDRLLSGSIKMSCTIKG